MRPLLLDLYCCQGGASAGYVATGFDVVGVDIDPQPRYPYPFKQGDAIGLLVWLLDGEGISPLDPRMKLAGERLTLSDFAAIHASPPCQAYSNAQRIRNGGHPELVDATRELLEFTGLPYAIENVAGAPLRDPVELCGSMFGLRTYRHRLFEANWDLPQPEHPPHLARQAKMGRPVRDGEFMHIVGNFSNVALAREIMGMPWANRDGLREAIPVAYAEYVGKHLMGVVRERALPARAEGVRA